MKKVSATDPIAHTSMKTFFPPGPGRQARGKAKAKRAKERKEKAKREKVKVRKEKERGKVKEKTKARKVKEKVKRTVAKGSLNFGVQPVSQPVTHGRTVGRIQIVNSHGTTVAKVAKVAKVVNLGDQTHRDLMDTYSISHWEMANGLLVVKCHKEAPDHQPVKGYQICVTTSRKVSAFLGISVVSPTTQTGDHLDRVHQGVTEDKEHSNHI